MVISLLGRTGNPEVLRVEGVERTIDSRGAQPIDDRLEGSRALGPYGGNARRSRGRASWTDLLRDPAIAAVMLASAGLADLGLGVASAETRGAHLTSSEIAGPSRHSAAARAATLASIVAPERAGLPDDWPQRSSFSEWHFMVTGGETFADVTAGLDAAQRRGAGTIMLYPPYHGDADAWLGALPIDIQRTSPAAGSMEDFEKLVKEAHRRGMAVTMYFGPQNIHRDSTLFQQAIADKAAGRETHATRSFIWSSGKKKPASLGVNQSGWDYSKEAKAWYATSWTHPAINLKSQDGVDEVANAIELWAKKGVDGLYVDAPDSHIGTSAADQKYLFGDLPRAYGMKYIFPEGQGPEALEQRFKTSGFNFGIFGPDLDSWGPVEAIFDGESDARGLETNLRRFRDLPVSQGGGAERPLVIYTEEQERNPEIRRRKELLSAAAYAGNGVHLDVFHRIEPEAENNFSELPADRREPLIQLMHAIAERPAQIAGAHRTALPTHSDPKHFAVQRTSRDGTQHALNIYNFSNRESWVTVDLSGTGITVGQTPRDAFSGNDAPPITGQQYRLKLPAHGFLLLDVDAVR